MTTYPIVYISWQDHYESSTEWTDPATHKPAVYVCETVGWLVKKTRHHYVVGRTCTQDGMVDALMNIMRKNVITFKQIEYGGVSDNK
jgi:CO dehydrogenase/acetyl-CoA synthase epsilon subunit